MFADQLTEVRQARAHRPGAVAEAAARRGRPATLLGPAGHLMIIAGAVDSAVSLL